MITRMKRRASTRKLLQRVDEKGKRIPGRFILDTRTKPYVPRILRGSIELPSERTIRAKAESKRKRKAARRLDLA